MSPGTGSTRPPAGAFDFSQHPQYAAFVAQGGVAEARLHLQLNTQFFVNGVGPITDTSFPADVQGNAVYPDACLGCCPAFMTGTAWACSPAARSPSAWWRRRACRARGMYQWLVSHGGLFPMLYADDAIVTGARLELVSAPVPEPGTWALLAAGVALLLAARRRHVHQPRRLTHPLAPGQGRGVRRGLDAEHLPRKPRVDIGDLPAPPARAAGPGGCASGVQVVTGRP